MNDIVTTLVEVTFSQREDFLKIKETLTRIGIASKKDNTLFQSCHILHKQGKYYIIHFKELFLLDGKQANMSEDDLGRRNTIANLLAEWGLVVIVDEKKTAEPVAPLNGIKIVSFKDKAKWNLQSKYSIGKSA